MRIAVACDKTGRRCGPFDHCSFFKVFHVIHSRITRTETWIPCDPKNAEIPPPGCQIILCTRVSRSCAATLSSLGVKTVLSVKRPLEPQDSVLDFLLNAGPANKKSKRTRKP